MSRAYDVASTWLGAGFRLGHALRVGKVGPRPTAPVVLYDYEACPFCRKVREACTVLDLDVLVKPCPRGGTRFRPEVEARGGKLSFPYLVDGDLAMYESSDIVAHLYARYGAGPPSWALTWPGFMPLSAAASAVRPGRGRAARPSRCPDQPLELWSYEESPYCRLARETLCELELPYLLHNIAHGSQKRGDFIALRGKRQFPFLVDPNTGAAMYESADICRYLENTYAIR